MARRVSAILAWRHWDRVALVAGGVPLTLFLIGAYTGKDLGGLFYPLILGALLLYMLSAAIAWRSGDGRLIAGGCAMIVIPVALLLPVFFWWIMLLLACVMGDCI